MTKREFQINLNGAETFRRLAESNELSFWEGYLRGVRRHYHGEIFGTDDEHALWMNLLTNRTSDTRRRYRGLGYQCGFNGTNVTDAMREFEQSDARSMAKAAFRSARSEAMGRL